MYTSKVRNHGAGRYLLYVNDDKESLLGSEQSNDNGWMEKIFFVNMAGLCRENDFLTGDWTARGIVPRLFNVLCKCHN